MRCEVEVAGLPPKKDGASSMWNKPVERERIKRLREAVASVVGDRVAPDEASVRLTLVLCAERGAGDLDNFITGICDALQACAIRTPVEDEEWGGVDSRVHPRRCVCLSNDRSVDRIDAERRPLEQGEPKYRMTIEW